jgi:hypothetical protein
VAEPEFLKSFKEQGVWAIEDVAGNDEVTLSRKFGNENIRLMFSIADIQSQEEDPAFADEEGEEPASEEEHIHSYGIRVAFSVTKVQISQTRVMCCAAGSIFLLTSQMALVLLTLIQSAKKALSWLTPFLSTRMPRLVRSSALMRTGNEEVSISDLR